MPLTFRVSGVNRPTNILVAKSSRVMRSVGAKPSEAQILPDYPISAHLRRDSRSFRGSAVLRSPENSLK